MKTKVENIDGCRRMLHVDVAWDEIAADYEELLQIYRNGATIPGFRKGKAPEQVVERRYLKDITEDVRERLLPRFYQEAIRAETLKPVSVLDVENMELARDEGFSFDVTLDVTPEFKLPKYKKLSLTGETIEITEAQVTQSVDSLRERLARFEDVTGRPAKAGDLVQIDYQGSLDDRPLRELGPEVASLDKASDFWALVDQPEFLPGMAAGLTGMEVGQTKTIDVVFPDDFRVPSLRGIRARYRVELKAMRERVLPAIDEEFLKTYNIESEELLRQQITEELRRQAQQGEQNRLRDQVAEILIDKTNMELPKSLVASETRQAFYSIARSMLRQGLSHEDMDARREQITTEAERGAARRVTLSFILSAVADEEALTVSDQEYEERIRDMAQSYRMTPEQLKAQLDEKDALAEVREDARRDKAMALILENAKIKR